MPGWAPFALGFRPFFLVAGWFGVLFMAFFLVAYLTQIWHYNYYELLFWHSHEMVFGYMAAVIAGFLLTAARNWTGLDTPTGPALGVLLALWLAPRILQAVPVVSPGITAILDIVFLPVLAIIVARVLWKAGQARSYIIPLVLLIMAGANGAMHLEMLGMADDVAGPAIQLALNLVIVLIALIAGRVMPFFIGSRLGVQMRPFPLLERFALPVLCLFILTELFMSGTWLAAVIAVAAGIVHLLRLCGWHHPGLWREPMLWVLYLGYGWLVVGLFLHALADVSNIDRVQALHAFTVGAIGMLTLGMMARVALGHTGRSIQALPGMTIAFVLMFMAAFVRVVLPIWVPAAMEWFIITSGTCWIAALLMFSLRYSLILMRPRIDGGYG